MSHTLKEYKELFVLALNTEEKREVITRAIDMEISFLLEDEEDMSDYIEDWNKEMDNINNCKDVEILNNYIDNYYIENNLEDIMTEFID